MDIVKYACVQNEDTGAVQNVVSLQEMSWAACVAPCAMSGVKSLPRCQEGLSEVWVQQGEAKKDAVTYDSRALQKHCS